MKGGDDDRGQLGLDFTAQPEPEPIADTTDDMLTRRSTSQEAYRDLVDSGSMTRMQRVVYDALASNGPITAGELQVMIIGLTANLMKTTVRRRMTDLYDAGWIVTCGKRVCRETGRSSMLWIARAEPVLPTVHHCTTCGQKISRNLGGAARKVALEIEAEQPH